MKRNVIFVFVIICLTISGKTGQQNKCDETVECNYNMHDSVFNTGVISDSEKGITPVIGHLVSYLKQKYPARNLFKEFDCLLFLAERDSIGYKLRISTENDTIYYVYKKYLGGGIIYRLWNTSDSIYGAVPFRKEPLLIKNEIIEWDTCKLSSRKRGEGRVIVGGEHYMISSRIIIKNGSHTIESVEHEDYHD